MPWFDACVDMRAIVHTNFITIIRAQMQRNRLGGIDHERSGHHRLHYRF